MRKLIEYLEKNHISYNGKMIDRFDAYRGGILQWNQFVNLTAIRDPEEFTLKHFVDSVTCCGLPEYKEAEKIMDMGTGAGFPGVPLAILSPDKEFILADSLNKRLKIIEELCQNIGITNVRTVHGRAEDLGRDTEHREKYDICLSRAVANLSVLAEYCLPFVRVGGHMLAYKGADAESELADAERAMKLLGSVFCRTEDVFIGDEAKDHKILVIKKGGKTPSKYPRKAGTPAKEPLK